MLKWSISNDGQLSRVRNDDDFDAATTSVTPLPDNNPSHQLTTGEPFSGTYCLAAGKSYPFPAADESGERETRQNHDLDIHQEPYTERNSIVNSFPQHQHPYGHRRPQLDPHSRSKSQTAPATASMSTPTLESRPTHRRAKSGTTLPAKSCLKAGSCTRPIPASYTPVSYAGAPSETPLSLPQTTPLSYATPSRQNGISQSVSQAPHSDTQTRNTRNKFAPRPQHQRHTPCSTSAIVGASGSFGAPGLGRLIVNSARGQLVPLSVPTTTRQVHTKSASEPVHKAKVGNALAAKLCNLVMKVVM